jgi:hypothetical protein
MGPLRRLRDTGSGCLRRRSLNSDRTRVGGFEDESGALQHELQRIERLKTPVNRCGAMGSYSWDVEKDLQPPLVAPLPKRPVRSPSGNAECPASCQAKQWCEGQSDDQRACGGATEHPFRRHSNMLLFYDSHKCNSPGHRQHRPIVSAAR